MAASEWVQVRVSPDEKARLKKILSAVREHAPVLTNAQVVRAALREGLAVLERKPARSLLGAASR